MLTSENIFIKSIFVWFSKIFLLVFGILPASIKLHVAYFWSGDFQNQWLVSPIYFTEKKASNAKQTNKTDKHVTPKKSDRILWSCLSLEHFLNFLDDIKNLCHLGLKIFFKKSHKIVHFNSEGMWQDSFRNCKKMSRQVKFSEY